MIFSPTIFRDKKFLVTGATGGAGRATAKLIAQCGGSVTVMGRDPERTERLKNELPGNGHDARYHCFIPEAPMAAQWFREAGGPFDGVFHAAGEEVLAGLAIINSKTIERALGPSLFASIGLLSAACSRKDSILKDGGSIVLMSSVAAVRGTSGMAIYAASKGAIESLVPSAALELALRRVRVNALRAGAFESSMHSRIVGRLTEQGMDDYAARHPLGFGKPEDIANMAVFLLSDGGRWITGSTLTADGGYSCGR